MHLVFIRHADPDYKNNTITEKGKREAELLALRAASWKVTDFFVSPYGRAVHTMDAISKATGRTAYVKEWLKEFDYRVKDPFTGEEKIPWDWMPRYFLGEKELHGGQWFNHPVMQTGNEKEHYEEVCGGFDEVLKSYGYTRSQDMPLYLCRPHLSEKEASVDTHLLPEQKDLDSTTLVFVCHLGVMFAIISHLLGISPVNMWQGMFVAPTSVTVLSTEERKPGEAVFRVQALGDTNHLTQNGENPSASGFFGNLTVF